MEQRRKKGIPRGSNSKASACNAGDLGSIPGLGRFHGERNGNPIQYFSWEIPCMEDPGRLPSMGCKELDMNE